MLPGMLSEPVVQCCRGCKPLWYRGLAGHSGKGVHAQLAGGLLPELRNRRPVVQS